MKKKNKHLEIVSDLNFRNITEKNLSFEQVFNRIIEFMKQEPNANYRLILGTDSQVFQKETRFITGIVIQREGKGAWACIRKITYPRAIRNLHEKISIETSLTEEIAYLFDEKRKNKLINIVLPHVYQGASLTIEGHIDIGLGKRNKTREYASEMISRIESTGMEAKVKPNSYVASCYANRYTK